MKKDENIRTYSAAELKRRRARGDDLTDLARVRAKTEAELERDIAGDPDWKDIPANWYENAQAAVPKPKKLISVRLDADVIDWFKGQGPGYQTRINAVLRVFMREHKERQRGAHGAPRGR
ncbi:MAG: BrnA antitoxin family protein [Alphaproteobacteria bacterium]|nr:BrnA antitoxin family protein [Alphaproteobacteria bacterium]